MKSQAGDPWYIHAALYLVIAILSVILIKVAIIDPKDAVEQERFFRTESRLRMNNIKAAEILFQKKFGNYSDNLNKLISFIKEDKYVDSVVNAFDSLTMRPANPFKTLSNGEFTAESLKLSPKSFQSYVLQIDTSISVDTTINRRGVVVKIDTTRILGTKYYLEDPDGYGTVGDLFNDALKNTSSWE
jgi:septal ring-binding cell division protein DamX